VLSPEDEGSKYNDQHDFKDSAESAEIRDRNADSIDPIGMA
jgi:hypothetical protein